MRAIVGTSGVRPVGAGCWVLGTPGTPWSVLRPLQSGRRQHVDTTLHTNTPLLNQQTIIKFGSTQQLLQLLPSQAALSNTWHWSWSPLHSEPGRGRCDEVCLIDISDPASDSRLTYSTPAASWPHCISECGEAVTVWGWVRIIVSCLVTWDLQRLPPRHNYHSLG